MKNKTQNVQTDSDISAETKIELHNNTIANRKKVPFYLKRNFKDNRFVIGLLAIPVLNFLIFWVYVNARTILLTLQSYNVPTGKYVWYGFSRFTDFFQKMVLGGDITVFHAFLNSFRALYLNILIILPLAFFAAYVFYKKIPGEKMFRVLFFLPSMISIVVLTLAYQYMFDVDFGPLSMLIKEVFHWAPDWFSTAQNATTIWPLIYIYCVWAGLGYNVILISGAMLRIPTEITESARLDGVGFWRECFSIVLPLVMPTISTFVILGTLGIFGFMIQPMLLAGQGGGYEGKTLTIALHIFNLVQTGNQGNEINAATYGLILTIIGAPLVYLVKFIMDKITPNVEM